MALAIPMSTNPADDPLRNGPPPPTARTAKPVPAMPRSSAGASGAAHLLGGGSPIAGVMADVMEIDKRIKSLAQVRPDIAQLFAAPLGQARDMMAGALADLAQGGTGTPPQDTVPPPQAGMPGMGMGGPGAGAGPAGMPPPPM